CCLPRGDGKPPPPLSCPVEEKESREQRQHCKRLQKAEPRSTLRLSPRRWNVEREGALRCLDRLQLVSARPERVQLCTMVPQPLGDLLDLHRTRAKHQH